MDIESDICPLIVAIPISVRLVAAEFSVKGAEAVLNFLPPINALPEFENDYARSNLQEGFDYAVNDPTILLDTFVLPEDMCQALIDGIRVSTTSIVSNGSYNPASPIGPVGTSAVIQASSTECLPRYWTKGLNLVIGPATLQSAYYSYLDGVIASFTVLEILVGHHNITEGTVIISLDGKTAT